MAEKSFVFDNKRERKIYELYLNPKGADINFIFDAGTEHPEKVKAHKVFLSLDSPVFDTMFFGSIPEKGDVPIVDVSAEAFIEFLQFFYLDEVKLSSANIVEVTNLCKKYEMNDFLTPCEKAFQSSLTIDEMCWGYGIAQLLEQQNLKKFCEEKIKMYAAKTIKSESFLECDSKLLIQILAIVASDWGALERVIACMEWSKAQCIHNNLDSSPKNLRDQLKDIFSHIPFDKLTREQFSQHVYLYKGFFTAEELEMFIQSSMPKLPNPFDLQSLQSDLPNIPAGQRLQCVRWQHTTTRNPNEFCKQLDISKTVFSSNATVLLVEFHLYDVGFDFQYMVCESGADNQTHDVVILKGKSRISEIVLSEPVVISPGKKYVIRVYFRNPDGLKHMINCLEDDFDLEYGIKITFDSKYEDKMIKMFVLTPDH